MTGINQCKSFFVAAEKRTLFLSPVPDRLCHIPVDTRLTPDRTQRALGDTALVSRHDNYAIAASILSREDVFLAPPSELYADLIQYPSYIPAG